MFLALNFLFFNFFTPTEKKKKPAPVPPKRVHKPVPSPRTVQDDLKITDIKEIDEQEIPVTRSGENFSS